MTLPSSADVSPYAGVERSTATGWVAWVFLGSILLVLLGVLHVCTGLIGLFRPEIMAGSRMDRLLPIGLSALAWAHMLLGVVATFVGVGLIRGRRWARLSAIALALLSAIGNFTVIRVYPVWSVTCIVLATVVMYAVAAHGSELAGA